MSLDPVAFTAELIRCPSITPFEGGALDLLQRTLEGMGFICRRLRCDQLRELHRRPSGVDSQRPQKAGPRAP